MRVKKSRVKGRRNINNQPPATAATAALTTMALLSSGTLSTKEGCAIEYRNISENRHSLGTTGLYLCVV
jgi:hypothetical protein